MYDRKREASRKLGTLGYGGLPVATNVTLWSREAAKAWRREVYGKSRFLLLNFAVNLKLL